MTHDQLLQSTNPRMNAGALEFSTWIGASQYRTGIQVYPSPLFRNGENHVEVLVHAPPRLDRGSSRHWHSSLSESITFEYTCGNCPFRYRRCCDFQIPSKAILYTYTAPVPVIVSSSAALAEGSSIVAAAKGGGNSNAAGVVVWDGIVVPF